MSVGLNAEDKTRSVIQCASAADELRNNRGAQNSAVPPQIAMLRVAPSCPLLRCCRGPTTRIVSTSYVFLVQVVDRTDLDIWWSNGCEVLALKLVVESARVGRLPARGFWFGQAAEAEQAGVGHFRCRKKVGRAI